MTDPKTLTGDEDEELEKTPAGDDEDDEELELGGETVADLDSGDEEVRGGIMSDRRMAC